MSKLDDVIDLIEAELEGSEEGEPNEMKNAPSQNPGEELRRVEDDLTGNSNDLDEPPDDEDDYEDQYDEHGIASEMVDRALLEQDSAYQTYFRGVMKKHGIKGIRGLSAEKRSAFFKDVSAGWRSRKKKVKESEEVSELVYKPGKGYEKGVLQGKSLKPEEKQKMINKTWNRISSPGVPGKIRKYNVRGEKVPRAVASEQTIYEEYKKYFKFMMEECGIDDLSELSEEDQAKFYGLVNEAFQIFNDQMQRPGAPIMNPMNPTGNMMAAMKKRRPERLNRAGAAKAMRSEPTKVHIPG